MCRSPTQLFRGEVIANNGPALHDEFDGFEDARVGQRVTADSDEIGVVACFERADFVGPAKEIRGIDGGSLDGVERLHAPFGHFAELSRVVTVRVDAGIRAEGNLCAGLESVAEIFTLQAADFLFLFDGFGKHSRFRAFLQNEVIVVNVEDEVGGVLLGEGYTFVVDHAGMFNGVDAGADGVLDGLRAVRVRGDFAAELVGFFGDGLHFFEGVLRRAGLIAFDENAAGGADFDDVGAVLHSFPDFGASGPGAVGDAFRPEVKFGGEQIVVAVPAGNAQCWTGDAHARAFDFARVNSIAKGDVRVAVSTDVSHRGETGAEGEAYVFHSGDCFAR